ncbi:MAG: hypothetical protein WBX01_13895 [Nitrososphaeraceae archaeon]
MSLFPDENVLTTEIESWRGFIDEFPSDEHKSIFILHLYFLLHTYV